MDIKLNNTAQGNQVVHILDDDAGMRASLDNLFRSVGYTTRAYASVSAFLAAGEESEPGCLVLDIRLPGMSGLDFQDQLRASGSGLPIILMTGHGDIPMSVRGMKGGAIDFLAKPFREQDMLDAVAAALTLDLETRASVSENADLRSRYETLSSREREVVALVVTGKLNKQIAFDLAISEITVKIHRGNAMRKMGARNLVDFIQIAEALKLGGRAR
ncbi:response regulator transcription factor [Neorhizobium galegae]|uniref:Response regulator transcription factor n=1 Tax=Neorhizobium galegae TaxID=399 RepID=A0A6A1TN53_NEOGA|nr:response regulator transcription factor [Neorhizobium galegae]KAB1085375.1 response regulator transcription factor [Neorhizobium galegae]